MADSWQTNWNEFLAVVESRLKNGASDKAVSDSLFGRTIQWSGTVEEIDYSDLSPAVVIFHDDRLDIGDGRFAEVSGLVLPITNANSSLWRRHNPGDNVAFTATFPDRDAAFPPFELFYFKTGRVSATIRLINAAPLS